MRILILVTIAALLAGCAMSPTELREQGDRQEFTLAKSPAEAAACVARNVENSGHWSIGYPTTSIRSAVTPGAFELTVSTPTSFLMVAEFKPASTGSVATAMITPNPANIFRDRMLKSFEGC